MTEKLSASGDSYFMCECSRGRLYFLCLHDFRHVVGRRRCRVSLIFHNNDRWCNLRHRRYRWHRCSRYWRRCSRYWRRCRAQITGKRIEPQAKERIRVYKRIRVDFFLLGEHDWRRRHHWHQRYGFRLLREDHFINVVGGKRRLVAAGVVARERIEGIL